MLGSSALKDLFEKIIATGLLNKIFHSVVIREEEGIKKPSAPIDGRWKYVGIDDTRGFSAYCRAIGPMEVLGMEKIGGCGLREYSTQTPHRLVFYRENEERDHDSIAGVLLKAVLSSDKIRFTRLITDPSTLLQMETPSGRFLFKVSTLYIGIDFYVLLKIQGDNCEVELSCKGLENPFH